MLVMRFNRVGRRNQPYFRIVVQEHTVAPGGRHVAVVGSYDPHSKEGVFKQEEIQKWISRGVQLSDSVHNLLVRQGIVQLPKRPVKVPHKEKTEESVPSAKQASAAVKDQETVVAEQAQETPKEEKKEESTTAQ